MRKIYLILLCGITMSGFSQEFGLKGGVNLGKERAMSNGLTITSQSSTSFLAGIYSEFQTSEELFFAPELVFSIDGGKFRFGSVTGVDRLMYISAPLLMKFYATPKISLHAGPQIGFLLKAETEIGGQKEDFTENVKPINLSLDFGGEIHLSTFNLGFRYVLGLSNLEDSDLDGEVKLSTIQIFAAFPLNF